MAAEPVRLEIEVLSLHGARVSGATVRLVGAGAECRATEEAPGMYKASLPAPDDGLLIIERVRGADAFDYRTFRAPLFFPRQADGSALLVAMDQPDGERSTIECLHRENGIYRARVRLDYLWFTHIGYQPTLGNLVDVMVDGEVGWAAVAAAIGEAKRSVHITTWLYQPSMEIVRPLPLAEPSEREQYTVQSILEERAEAGALVRLLLWDAPLVNIARQVRTVAREPGDNLEVMQEVNPTERPLLRDDEWPMYNKIIGTVQIGSHHQKTVVVDGEVGFCTGMNLKENDWDSGDHAIFDPRRCRFDRPSWFRRGVSERRFRSDHRPRHDFMARVEGPSVADIERNFAERWNRLLDRGAEYAENATRAEPPGEAAAPKGPSQVQVIRTMPEPYPERGILDVYLRAIKAARKLIYIEDQYFRSIHVCSAMAEAARAFPDLKLIVTTMQEHADAPLAGSWARECFERVARYRPDFELYGLCVAEADSTGTVIVEPLDNHAKLMMVDDIFFTVGSCNINDRGFEFESELNVAVVDPELARTLRVGLWRSHLGGDERVTGDIDGDVAVWKEHAERNRSYDPVSGSAPAGHVFAFVPRAERTLLFGHHVF